MRRQRHGFLPSSVAHGTCVRAPVQRGDPSTTMPADASTRLPVPRIGLGTWQMERDDRSDALAALRRGLELGMTHVDTAEMYGAGAVERIVGEAIAGRRDEVFLASKVLPSHADRAGTITACEASLKRLGTDRLDLYMLHWPGPHPLAETFAGFERLLADGKILRAGVSNFDAADIASALDVGRPETLACNQVLYHPSQRAIEHEVLPICRRHGIPVVAYSPFGSGSFPEPESPQRRVLEAIARRHGATARQIALAFVLRHDGIWTIPKSSRVEHVEDNAGASAIRLADEDVTELEAAFPLGPPGGLPVI